MGVRAGERVGRYAGCVGGFVVGGWWGGGRVGGGARYTKGGRRCPTPAGTAHPAEVWKGVHLDLSDTIRPIEDPEKEPHM